MIKVGEDGVIYLNEEVATMPAWEYEDTLGVKHIGYVEAFVDHGGSDVSYHMRDSTTGMLSVISGRLLKSAKSINSVIVLTTKNHPTKGD